MFGRGFYWGEALDALADVYNGVCDYLFNTKGDADQL